MNGRPAAIEKAESLYRFALNSGAQVSTFVLCLKPHEAQELLEWYATQYAGRSEQFDLDLEVARVSGDPWQILDNFQLLGLTLARAELVLH